MAFVRCDLPHPLFLVLTERCLQKAAEDYAGIPLPQSLADVEHDLLNYSEEGVLTLVSEKQAENLRISFCTARYELVCGLTQQQDAFFVQRMAPLSLRTHNQITHGAVLTLPQTWGIFSDLSDFNQQLYGGPKPESRPTRTGIELILEAWKQTRPPGSNLPNRTQVNSAISPDELSFLANVDTLIDVSCQLELEKAARQERVPVKGVTQPNEERFSSNVYRFQLASAGGFRVGAYLRTGVGDGSEPGADGFVLDASGTSLVLRFRQPLELRQLQRVEWLAPQVSTRQYSIQHAAVNALRNGESLNPALLPLIVENRFEDYALPEVLDQAERHNLAQQTLIERAMLVPDLLLALGPPGTGKTDTIRAIAARQAALGKKVLVTSKNNKAVDNVLAGLGHLQTLRIGREEVVTPEVRPMLIDQRAASMQQQILSNIEPVQASLEGMEQRWNEIQQGFEQLARLTGAWRGAQTTLERQLADVASWQRDTFHRVQPVLNRQLNRYFSECVRLNQTVRLTEKLRRRLNRLHALSRIPLLGQFVILWAGKLAEDWQQAAKNLQTAQEQVAKLRDSIQSIWQAYRLHAVGSEEVLLLKRAVLQAEDALQAVLAELTEAQTRLTRLADSLHGAPLLQIDTPQAVDDTLREWRAWTELSRRRKGLLSDWRELLQARPQVLYPALIRGADVIGATCIGIATDARFEDLAFDLVIADEAGQVQVMDLLVPLVRARRAVLVGDHLQLPPVVEPEITARIRENEPENRAA